MSVFEAVEHELDALGAKGALRANALRLAESMDAEGSRTSLTMASKELREALREIRSLAPPKKQEDRVDEIAKRRQRRLAKTAG